jgi:hypothetical protein
MRNGHVSVRRLSGRQVGLLAYHPPVPRLLVVVGVTVLSVAGLAASGCGGGAGGSQPASDSASIVALVRDWYARSNSAVCTRFTDDLLRTGWGKTGSQGRQACRAAVGGAKPVQAVSVDAPAISGDRATVKVDYTTGGARRADEVGFVRVDGAWLVNTVTGGATPTPAATTGSSAPQAGARTGQEGSTAPVPQFLATMTPVGGSHEHGTAVLRGTASGTTFAVLLMKRAPAAHAEVADVVHGTCSRPGGLAHRLGDVEAGTGISSETLRVPLATFGRGSLAVIVRAGGAASPVASCGDLHRG